MSLSSVFQEFGSGFVHVIDGVERAFLSADQLEPYLRNLEPVLLGATAAIPQLGPVTSVLGKLFQEAQAVVSVTSAAAAALEAPAPAPAPAPASLAAPASSSQPAP